MSFLSYLKDRKPVPLIYSEDLNEGCKNVLLIDNNVENAQMFLTSANDSTFPIIYSHNSTKTELLELLKRKFTTIERIGIVFTSNLGSSKRFLDNKPFFTQEESSVIPYSENVEFILNILKEFSVKNIDYLACDTLNYPNWENYYQILSKETGVIVGASNDKTGNVKYGGDWIMESTSQDIEVVYFTKKIEYYQYLLDNLTWATGLTKPVGLATSGSYLYATDFINNSGGRISQIKLSDGSIFKSDWATLELNYYPISLVISGSYLYLGSNYYNQTTTEGRISKINLSDGSIVKSDWATGLNGAVVGLAISGSYLYAANNNFNNINNYYGIISKIKLSDGSIESNWATGFKSLASLTISGSYLYAPEPDNNRIIKIKLSDGSIESNWATGLSEPVGLTTSGSYLYVSSYNNGTISQFDLPPLPTPTPLPPSNICFPANTPILTDQGMIPIEKINPDKHTINNKKIVDITKTITLDNYLVCFKKNALGMNRPTEKTIMSKDHKVYYQGQMLEAKNFLGKFVNVIKVKYNGEILYNVLMEKYDKIYVNNLICETLHPDNIIAKLYTRKCKYTNEVRDKIIALLEKCAEKKDYKTYNKMIKSII